MQSHDTSATCASEKNVSHIRLTKRITWIGLGTNLFLSILKFIVGFLGNSQAVIADAIHSLSDMTTDVAVLFGVKFWSAPADDNHPYGHERIETVVTIVIGIILALVAWEIGFNAISTVRDVDLEQPGKIALIGSIVSIILKEILYRWTASIGKRIKSPALMANAWHHRSDALSSIPVLLAVGASLINPVWAFVDRIGAFIVSLFILKVARDIIKPALFELTDRGASQKDRDEIRQIVMKIKGIQSVHKIRTRKLGYSFFVDLHVLVDGEMTVRQGHEISEIVQRELIDNGPDIVDVVVHIEPHERNSSNPCLR